MFYPLRQRQSTASASFMIDHFFLSAYLQSRVQHINLIDSGFNLSVRRPVITHSLFDSFVWTGATVLTSECSTERSTECSKCKYEWDICDCCQYYHATYDRL